MMSRLGIALVLGLLTGARAQLLLHNVTRPPCDSPDVKAAALVAQDYLNGQHTHGYKYALNQIDNIKIQTKVSQSWSMDNRIIHRVTYRYISICLISRLA